MANREGSKRAGDPVRRAGILGAAEKLFRHYGFGKTTIGDIAREAGIGVGSVYLEFCSKDEIVAELSERRHHRVLAAMRAAAERETGPRKLSAALEARVAALYELEAEGAHSCDLVSCQSKRGAYTGFREDERRFVARLIEEELGRSDGERAARLVERAFATLCPPWLFELRPAEGLAAAREVAALVESGLAASAKRRAR